ncbi:hypothetical protein CMV_011324 [Castanea mollissima]|uniref:Uncharacterized protein n=1 Tax=Castanea mollissima TaxID=60419 RepID=A0A8J4R421_9ROSI|nr:hypothetical protein CMV_011324 [Castanea mollissima]
MQASHHRHIPPKPLIVQMVVCSPRLSRKAECYEHKTKLLAIQQDFLCISHAHMNHIQPMWHDYKAEAAKGCQRFD